MKKFLGLQAQFFHAENITLAWNKFKLKKIAGALSWITQAWRDVK